MKKIKFGFTLIETIVVVAVIALTLPVLIGTIFILVREQTKVVRLSQVKREGDYLINIIENTVKNRAVSIHSAKPSDETNLVCNLAGDSFSGPPLYFLDEAGKWFGYQSGVNTVATASAISTINLTSNKTILSNFSISCIRNTIFSPASILLDFDICYDTGAGDCVSVRPEEVTTIHYQTRIKLRNY